MPNVSAVPPPRRRRGNPNATAIGRSEPARCSKAAKLATASAFHDGTHTAPERSKQRSAQPRHPTPHSTRHTAGSHGATAPDADHCTLNLGRDGNALSDDEGHTPMALRLPLQLHKTTKPNPCSSSACELRNRPPKCGTSSPLGISVESDFLVISISSTPSLRAVQDAIPHLAFSD